MSIHEKALNGMFDDMDDLETKKMFPKSPEEMEGKGFSVTITMTPDQSHEEGESAEGVNPGDMENLPADQEPMLSEGGMIGEPKMGEAEDLTLPPFLRKKKNPTGK